MTRWTEGREMDTRPEFAEGCLFGGWWRDGIRRRKTLSEALEEKSADAR